MNKEGKNKIDYSKMKKVKYVNTNIDNSPHLYLSFNQRLFILFVLISLFCWFSYFLINKSFASYNTTTLEYGENGIVNYDIQLVDNDYYANNTQESGRGYVSSLIDKISTNMQYNTFLSNKVVLAYNYNVVGKLYIYSEEGNILLDEEYKLVDEQKDTIYGKKLNIMEDFTIDYKKYNDIAKDYVNTYAPNATSKFVVTMNVSYDGEYENFNETQLNHKAYIEMSIPLLKDTITIDVNTKNLKPDGYYEEVVLESGINNLYSYFGLASLIIATMLAIRFISLILVLKPKKSKYSALRDGYLKDYDRIIVNTKTLPKFTNANIIDCYDFNELLDAQSTLELPIHYHEIVRNQKCVFYIRNGKDIYKYTLKECDLEY